MRRAGHMPGAGRTQALARWAYAGQGMAQATEDASAALPEGTRTQNALTRLPPLGTLIVGGVVFAGINWLVHYGGARIGHLPPTEAKKAGKGGVLLSLGLLAVVTLIGGAAAVVRGR